MTPFKSRVFWGHSGAEKVPENWVSTEGFVYPQCHGEMGSQWARKFKKVQTKNTREIK